MSGLQAVPAGGAIHVRRRGVAEGERAIGDADARVEIEWSGGDDRVVEAECGEVLPLREQCRCTALHVSERDHGANVHRATVCSACTCRPIFADGTVKKCASCTKDLPDAALHCVFCGAKQPPAPATAGGVAKTVLGSYSANDVIDSLKHQGRP